MQLIKGSTKYYIDQDGNIFNHKGLKLKPFTQTSKKSIESGKSRISHMKYAVDLDIGRKLVHRVIAENLVPGYFEGAVVDHIDRNPCNNHPSNLRWTTQRENRLNIDEVSRIKKVKETWRRKNASS